MLRSMQRIRSLVVGKLLAFFSVGLILVGCTMTAEQLEAVLSSRGADNTPEVQITIIIDGDETEVIEVETEE